MANAQENAKNKEVHLLYKKLGETPNETILRFKRENLDYADKPITYAGRLDPMAEGLLLVLSGEKLKDKDKYLGLQKTYECEILWGFETDTLDVLGLVNKSHSENYFHSCLFWIAHKFLLKFCSLSPYRRCTPFASDYRYSRSCETSFLTTRLRSLQKRHEWMNFFSDDHLTVEQIKKILKKPKGKFEQKYPAYSSKPVSGRPLFKWAREGKLSEILIPSHEVEIFDARFISRSSVSGNELLKNIDSKIVSVSGDFRQKEILDKWEKVLGFNLEKQFIIDKISLTVSGGFYVRQFISDIATDFDVLATTFHIKRTSVGEYTIAETTK